MGWLFSHSLDSVNHEVFLCVKLKLNLSLSLVMKS